MWPLKKFSFSTTPALIKRDIVCLFSRKARAEKRAKEERQRTRLEMKPCVQGSASNTIPAQAKAPQTPVRSQTAPKAAEPHSASKETISTRPTFDSCSSPNTRPTTAATSLVSATKLPTTYGAAMAYFDFWYLCKHSNVSIPQPEREMFRGIVIVLHIALLKCFKEATYSPLIGFRPDEFRLPHNPSVLAYILARLTDDRQDAQQLAEDLLSIIDVDLPDLIYPEEFFRRVGFAKTRITDVESNMLHKGFEGLLGRNGKLCC